MPTPRTTKSTHRPIYWFACLDQALDRGDLQLAASAVHELQQMGIVVRIPRMLPAKLAKAGRQEAAA